MANANGTIILNGVTDRQMELIWGFKSKHEGAFSFAPNVIQIAHTPQGPIYNNVQFSYSTVKGLNVITEIVNHLESEERRATGLAQ